MLDLEIIKKSERQKLCFATQLQLSPLPEVLATLCFKDQDVMRQYEVKIIEEPPAIMEAAE